MPNKKSLVIINPFSKSGHTQTIIAKIKELFASVDADYAVTSGPLHAEELAAASRGYETIIVVGGDGTCNEVVNGLMRIEESKRPVLSLIPSGSGNDTCRMADIPLDIEKAVTIALTGKPKKFDVGKCNDRYFINSCSIGIDAIVVAKTLEYKERLKWSGPMLYGAALLHVITHDLHPIEVMLSADGGDACERLILLCAVTNGKTYGSGITINPSASPDDGHLSMATIDRVTIGKALRSLPKIMAKRIDEVDAYRTQEISEAILMPTEKRELVAQIDGEVFVGKEFVFTTYPRAVQIMVTQ
ncbi:MAG: diacylglycerol kinase family lipid kinase [Coriobacteriia bacterium]|nr:diacylglycerol kinase family lipid kinase [Coriobacteriia bacterium]